MKPNTIKTVVTLFVALLTIASMASIGAIAHEGHESTTEVTVGANESEYDNTTIQEAVNYSSEYDHIVIENGTYNTSVNLTTDNLYFEAESGNVTIDGSNTTSGVAFQNPEDYNYTTADNVTLVDMASGGSGDSDGTEQIIVFLTTTVFGVPYWLVALAILAVGYVVSEREE